MFLDLSDLIKNDSLKKEIDLKLEVEKLEFMGEDYVFENGITLKGTIYNNSKNLELKAVASADVKVNCVRCLKSFKKHFEIEIFEILTKEENASNTDFIVIDGTKIDIEPIVIDNFFLNIEGRYLCSEDCKGLCPVCGIDLNEKSCNCETNDIDPRWASLLEIMKDTTTQ